MGRIGAMRLNAVEDLEIEIPVRLFLSLDDNGKEELEDVECDDIDMDKKDLMKYIEDNDLLPEKPDWQPSCDDEDRYDELRDMQLGDD